MSDTWKSAESVWGAVAISAGSSGPFSGRARITLFITAATVAVLLCGCRPSDLPKPGTKRYLDEVKAFYVGLAALQVGDDVRADSTLERATQLAKGEPASWANWGVLSLRQGNFEAAAQRLGKAQSLVPENDQIHYLLGILESKRGNPSQAIAELQRAVGLNPRNVRAMYLLAQEVERRGDANGEAEFEQLLQKLLQAQPGNAAVLLELGRAAAKRSQASTLHAVVDQLSASAATWPPEVQPQWTALQGAAAGADPRAAAVRFAFLRNSLMRLPQFRQSLSVIQPAAGTEAVPFRSFLVLPTPNFDPPPSDASIHFQAAPVSNLAGGAAGWIGASRLLALGLQSLRSQTATELRWRTGQPSRSRGARRQTVLLQRRSWRLTSTTISNGSGSRRRSRRSPDAAGKC